MEISFACRSKIRLVYKLNAQTGKITWKSQVGNGGILGGVHFGMTSDGKNLYVPISDRKTNRDYDKDARPGLYAVELEKGDIMEVSSNNICQSRKALYGDGNALLATQQPYP